MLLTPPETGTGLRFLARAPFGAGTVQESVARYRVDRCYCSCVRERRRVAPAGSERVLQAAWPRLEAGITVKGRDGAVYTIVYSGRPADEPGPDFRDAPLRGPDGLIRRGDVEIYVRQSGWRAHRHHLDPRYNDVAFHITGGPAVFTFGELAGSSRMGSRTAHMLSGRPLHLLLLQQQAQAQPGEFNNPASEASEIRSSQMPGSVPDLFNGVADDLPAEPVWVTGERPDNSPERRLAAAAVLAKRWREVGPLKAIIEVMRKASGAKDLIGALRVGGEAPLAGKNGVREQHGLILMYRAITAGPLYAVPPVSPVTRNWRLAQP